MTSQYASKRRLPGFSLIELIIAMAIGFFLTTVIVVLYFNVRSSFRHQEDSARLQETGRFAMERLAREIRMAGYNGCGSVSGLSNVLVDGEKIPYLNLFSAPVFGYEGGVSTFPTEIIGANAIEGDKSPDVLIVLGVDSSSELVVKSHDPSSVTITSSQHSIQPGEILMITDCNHSSIFQMTGPPNTNNKATTVTHNVSTNKKSGTNCTKHLGGSCSASTPYTFKPGSSLLRIYSNAYFIAPSSVGNGLRSLWAMSLTGSTTGAVPTEIMDGVEDMQITYGQDTDGNVSADKFVTADTLGADEKEWAKVVSVKISLLVKSAKNNIATQPQTYSFNGSDITATDKSLFKVYTETVTLRNRAP